MGETDMSRIVSFSVLVAILLAVAVLFFKVMANFLLPVFLAVLLVVMFRPLHGWILARCKGHGRVAAGLTTLTIVLLFLGPFSLILAQAASEGASLYHELELSKVNLGKVTQSLVDFADRFGIELSRESVEKTIGEKLREWMAPLAMRTGQYLGATLVGICIMVVSLYYFLADGPAMVRTIMRLSPLDNKYEEQLMQQFDNISRAVVLATLLSAFTQGLLAGVGFYFAGFESVFLMMVLAMLLAMVPFVGAAAVWVPACLWLYFHGEHGTAIGLAIWGAAVVSMVDNLIKPAVLHGRSNLHPLLALLSVLGGVQALGPIGIFVGPMVVVFLHVILNMLHSELNEMDDANTTVNSQSNRR
jgi:predicted PurR-regulated permease PerM